MKEIRDSLILDPQDEHLRHQYDWSLSNSGVQRHDYSSGVDVCVKLSRQIMNAKEGTIVDHINGNQLDNRRSNLRFVTRSVNRLNGGVDNIQKKASKFRGVTRGTKDPSKWRARITLDGKSHFLGQFKTEEEARVAYQTALESYTGGIKTIYATSK